MPNPSDILGGLPREIIDTINGAATARPKPSEILGGYHKELIDALSGLAHLDSPALTGTPTAPTADAGDESEQIATTEFVQQEIAANPAHLELMSPTTIGGAKLGDGLAITDGALGIDPDPQESTGEVRGAVSSLTAKGWATQDGTPTPESPVAIQVARGRNLAMPSEMSDGTANGITWTHLDNGVWRGNGTASSTSMINRKMFDCGVLPAGTYIASAQLLSGSSSEHYVRVGTGDDSSYSRPDGSYSSSVSTRVIDADGSTRYWLSITVRNGSVLNDAEIGIQLELGSTPTPYVPYGHVGVEARQGSTLISAIHVPLPSKGYAAALPDGTADVLTIDGAGKVEWASAVARIESYDGESVGATYLSTTGSLTTGAEVYYPLATPATEDFGYIDWPTIPDGAVITCPELDALGVRYLIGNGVAEMAREWYERGHAEAQATSTALGELAQSVLDVDGKADAVAAQLVAEDVSSDVKAVLGLSPRPTWYPSKAYKILGLVWFIASFKSLGNAFGTTSTNVLELTGPTAIPSSLGITKFPVHTNIPNINASIETSQGGTYVTLASQDGNSVTIPNGTDCIVSGIYYVG